MKSLLLRRSYWLLAVAGILLHIGCVQAEKTAPEKSFNADSLNVFDVVLPGQKGAIASVHPLATRAGAAAFARGGNAIDAALAVAFTLGVVDGHNSGIGGGCFILARLADGTILAIDGREMAPQKAHRDMYVVNGKVDTSLSKTGALAMGIPGSVAALHQLQERGGKLKFADVLRPATDLAEQGFPIGAVLSKRLQRTAPKLAKFPAAKAVYFNEKGIPLKEGDTLIQKDLANTYRQLAKKGPSHFYQGDFAKATADWMAENDGLITLDDFKKYHTVLREPVVSNYRGLTVYGFPPPSSGGIHVAQMLNILKNFDLQKMPPVDRRHVIAEAMKLAFADRAYWLGDADFVPVPKGLISESYAQKLAEKIALDKATEVPQHNIPPDAAEKIFGKHTTHIATADKAGNWVAITTTVNTSFGSKVVIPGTGVVMNNQMDDFSIQPGVPNAFGLVGAEANAIAPGKRPLSSMSPTLVMQGDKPFMTLGAAGGPTIITQVLQTLIQVVDLNANLDEALAAARIHHQWKPDMLIVDDFVSNELELGLRKKGHMIKKWSSFGATQAILWKDGQFNAASEPRIRAQEEE